MSTHHLSNTTFQSFDLDPRVRAGIDSQGFQQCTPIQAETLPIVLKKHDVAGQAQTGTGKTAAFLIATFQHLLSHPADEHRKLSQPRAIILAPTRELAIQIHKDAEGLGSETGLSLGLVYGGVDYEKQRQTLKDGIDVLIGTPGRIIDYFKQGVFDLRAIQVMVLDEADRMFDLGFIKDIRFLLRRMPDPDKRLSMLFSATLSYRVLELAYEHMNNPQKVQIEPEEVTTDRIQQSVFYPANEEKWPLLINIVKQQNIQRGIVFVNTKRVAENAQAWLKGNEIGCETLSGDVRQNKRQRFMQEFAEGKFPLLIATDVAARGLHIPDVTHVINFDLPQSSEDYVHRIGRTARAGATGQAISFACEEYVFHLPEIEEYIGQKIPREDVTSALLAEIAPRAKIERASKPPHGKKGGGNHRRRR